MTSGVDRRVAVTRACTISVSEICATFRLSTLAVRPSVSVATSDSVFSAFGFSGTRKPNRVSPVGTVWLAPCDPPLTFTVVGVCACPRASDGASTSASARSARTQCKSAS